MDEYDLSGFDMADVGGGVDLSNFNPGDFGGIDLSNFDPATLGDMGLTGVDLGGIDQLQNMDLGGLGEMGLTGVEDAVNNTDWQTLYKDTPNVAGYFDEETGKFIADPNGPLQRELTNETSGTNLSSMDNYTYDKATGTWTAPDGSTYTPDKPPSHTAKSGAQIMVDAGALPPGYNGLQPTKGSTAYLMSGQPGWSNTGGGGGGSGSGSGRDGKDGSGGGGSSFGIGGGKDNSMLMMLLMMMMMMNQNKNSGGGGTIPALAASSTQLPYGGITQTQGQPANYRPGQGGITYFTPTTYTPKMAGGGGIGDLQGGRLLDGPGDGVSDSIPATIGGFAGGGQPARLARGEYVMDARTVAALGNGSTDAGAERLDAMRKNILSSDRKAGIGKDSKAYRHLLA